LSPLLPENAPARAAKVPPLALAQGLFYKSLTIKDNRHLSRRHSNGEASVTCVFFAQHLAEIVRLDL
jgi:hypothetical protein